MSQGRVENKNGGIRIETSYTENKVNLVFLERTKQKRKGTEVMKMKFLNV